MLWYISTEKIDNKRTASVLGTSRNVLNCLFLLALNKINFAWQQFCFVQRLLTLRICSNQSTRTNSQILIYHVHNISFFKILVKTNFKT